MGEKKAGSLSFSVQRVERVLRPGSFMLFLDFYDVLQLTATLDGGGAEQVAKKSPGRNEGFALDGRFEGEALVLSLDLPAP